jgi:ATP-dependent Clp protease ATP-binding subunit ClpC
MQLRQALQEREQHWYALRVQERPVVTPQQISEIVALWTGIPLGQITTSQVEHLLHLEDALHQRVIGQNEAIEVIARAVRRAYADIRDPRRPIGSFLFVGPTGVGKTELARALASTLFVDESALLKLDMSEFMERHQAARLLGSPPGYVGYDDGGQLTEFVRRRPYSILLFDEIEKAHWDVFDLLLQILEDGRLTDARGKVVDFKNTIVIMTSNLGTSHLQPSRMAFSGSSQMNQSVLSLMRERALAAVKDFFRPELLHRIDEQVFFHPLELTHLQQIVDLFIRETRCHLAQQSVDLEVTAGARDLLVQRGYEPIYGARPLRRAVQRMLEDLLAEAILHNDLAPGDLAVVDREADLLVVHPRTAAICAGHKQEHRSLPSS